MYDSEDAQRGEKEIYKQSYMLRAADSVCVCAKNIM